MIIFEKETFNKKLGSSYHNITVQELARKTQRTPARASLSFARLVGHGKQSYHVFVAIIFD